MHLLCQHSRARIHPHLDNEDGVFKQMIRLYAHDDTVLKDLEQARVNPDFTSEFRNDLEFFIPQVCSFYLQGEFMNAQQLREFLLMACSTSFFFSHRIWFFFQSVMFNLEVKDYY